MTSLLSYLLACYKMELLSGGNYTHASTIKVMPPSHFPIRLGANSLLFVSIFTIIYETTYRLSGNVRFYSQIENSELLFFQSCEATVCFV